MPLVRNEENLFPENRPPNSLRTNHQPAVFGLPFPVEIWEPGILYSKLVLLDIPKWAKEVLCSPLSYTGGLTSQNYNA